jgi:GNAT superfamily N-acetyltransferase
MGIEIARVVVPSFGFRFDLNRDGEPVGHAFLYGGWNTLHNRPFGLMEDLGVVPEHQRKGFGTQLFEKVRGEARDAKQCYKLIATSRHSRPEVHDLYLKLGFTDWGREFRMDFK